MFSVSAMQLAGRFFFSCCFGWGMKESGNLILIVENFGSVGNFLNYLSRIS